MHWTIKPTYQYSYCTCRYPVRILDSVSDDPRSVAEYTKALVEEIKAKPRDAVLGPLMKSTFQDTRVFIQNDATTVTEILQVYPPLTRPVMVGLFFICIHSTIASMPYKVTTCYCMQR